MEIDSEYLERLSLPHVITKQIEEKFGFRVMMSVVAPEQNIQGTNIYFGILLDKKKSLVFDGDILCNFDGTLEIKPK